MLCVKIWGRKTELVVINGNLNAQGYINQVLGPVLVPFIAMHVSYARLCKAANRKP